MGLNQHQHIAEKFTQFVVQVMKLLCKTLSNNRILFDLFSNLCYSFGIVLPLQISGSRHFTSALSASEIIGITISVAVVFDVIIVVICVCNKKKNDSKCVSNINKETKVKGNCSVLIPWLYQEKYN